MSISKSQLIVSVLAASFVTSSALWVPDNVKRAEESTKAESTTKKEASPTTKAEPKPTTESKTTTKAAAASSTHKSASTAKETTSDHKSTSTAKSSETHPTSITGSGTSAMPTGSSSMTTSLPSASSSSQPSTSGGSSSGGIIGGIIAAVVIVVLGAAAFLVIRKRKRSRQNTRARLSSKPDPFTMGFGNDSSYNNNFPPQQQQSTYQKQQSTFDNYEVAEISPSNNAAIQQPIAATAATAAATTATAATATATTATNISSTTPPSLGTFYVIATYIPTLSDELEIETGDHIELIVEYDDGWCQGINVSKGYTKGVFPRHCIDYATAPSNHAPNSDYERSKRVSSMYQIK
ncbi:hypothetical protein MBANPS3_008909 [Mucor bainieri]